jgi:hypothetical protein
MKSIDTSQPAFHCCDRIENKHVSQKLWHKHHFVKAPALANRNKLATLCGSFTIAKLFMVKSVFSPKKPPAGTAMLATNTIIPSKIHKPRSKAEMRRTRMILQRQQQ